MSFTKIPPLAQYVTPFTGDERFEIATNGDVATALSRNLATRDLLKTIGVLPNITPFPAGNYRIGLFRSSDGLLFSSGIDQLGIPLGNVPPGGLTGQVLAKLSNTSFDDNWSDLVFTGEVTGNGALPLPLTITAHIVTNAKLAQAAALSVKGNPTNALADVQDVVGAANQVLRVNSAGTSWAWGSINLASAAAVTGALGPTNGGTGQSTYTLGDILYSDATNSLAKLAGNITTTRNFLRQVGNGAVSAAPAWDTILGADVAGAALTKTDDTNVTLTLGGTPATALLRAAALTLGWTGTLAVARGGIGVGTLTNHGILLGQGTSAVAATAVMTDGQILVGQSAADPLPKTLSADATLSAAGALTIANATVTYAKFQNIAGLSVVGRSANSSGVGADITGVDKQILRVSGTTLGFGSIDLSSATAVSNQLNSASMPALTGAVVSAGATLATTSTIDLVFVIGDGTSTISTGIAPAGSGGYWSPPFDFAGTIVQWSIVADASGSISIDLLKCTFSQFDAGATHPVSGDKISASAPITFTTTTKGQSSTLTGWTTTFSANDILAFNVASVTTCKQVKISLKVTKTS